MSVHFFAIRIETHRLVAAEIQDRAAAALLDSGQQILLGTVEELGKLATRLQRQLVTISRAPARSGPRRNPMPARIFRAASSEAASEATTRPAPREQLSSVSAAPAGGCLTGPPAVRVA